jgi:succinate dehydrogenase / fumarate reductase cytochrome b subunit
MTAVMSILHRFTGVLLTVGLMGWVICLMAIAEGPEQYQWIRAFWQTVFGKIFLWGWLYALFFHLCHGVRHLFWDSGHGFDPGRLNRDAWLEFTASILLVGLCFLVT